MLSFAFHRRSDGHVDAVREWNDFLRPVPDPEGGRPDHRRPDGEIRLSLMLVKIVWNPLK
jgi:hypothetical protein